MPVWPCATIASAGLDQGSYARSAVTMVDLTGPVGISALKRLLPAVIIITVLLVACASGAPISPLDLPERPSAMAPARGRCGDRRCDGPENARNCPRDCGTPATALTILARKSAPAAIALTPTQTERSSYLSGPEPDTYWAVNPSSGARLFVRLIRASGWKGVPAASTGAGARG
jgi:hypothetical protein